MKNLTNAVFAKKGSNSNLTLRLTPDYIQENVRYFSWKYRFCIKWRWPRSCFYWSGPYKCSEPACGRTFIQLSNLQQHMSQHSGKPEKARGTNFHCQICGKGFATDSSLALHCEKKHKELVGEFLRRPPKMKPFLCTICNKGYTTESALSIHAAKVSTIVQIQVVFPRLIHYFFSAQITWFRRFIDEHRSNRRVFIATAVRLWL